MSVPQDQYTEAKSPFIENVPASAQTLNHDDHDGTMTTTTRLLKKNVVLVASSCFRRGDDS